MPCYVISTEQGSYIFLVPIERMQVFHTTYPPEYTRDLRTCEASSLTGLPVFNFDENQSFQGKWPALNQQFSSQLILNVMDAIYDQVEKKAKSHAEKLLPGKNHAQKQAINIKIDLCLGRSLMLNLIPENQHTKKMLDNYIHKPNFVFSLGIPSLYVQQININLMTHSISVACSDYIDPSSHPETIPWLQTSEEVHQNLVVPYLNFLEALHQRRIVHGDMTESNAIFSEHFKQLIFVDFKHLFTIPFVDETRNEHAYYTWQKARLIDLENLCRSIETHAGRINPDLIKNDPVIRYLSSLSEQLQVLYDNDAYAENYDYQADKQCILKFISLNIGYVIQQVNQLIDPENHNDNLLYI